MLKVFILSTKAPLMLTKSGFIIVKTFTIHVILILYRDMFIKIMAECLGNMFDNSSHSDSGAEITCFTLKDSRQRYLDYAVAHKSKPYSYIMPYSSGSQLV